VLHIYRSYRNDEGIWKKEGGFSIESPFFGALALALCAIMVTLLLGIDTIFNDGIKRTILH